jgi:PAS domain S-box-containing protein
MDAVIMLTGNGNIQLFNNAAELLTGYCEYEIRGKCFSEFITIINEKTQLPFSEFIKKCSHTKRMDGCQGIMIAKDGSHKRILFHGDLVRGISDGDEHILLVLHDITVQEKFQDENIKMCRLESISLLAGGVAQDFNAILMCITANLFKAKMIIHDSAEARALITDAERAAFRATCLTKQLLIISKNGAPVKENTSIKALIEGAVGFCLSGFSVDYCLQLPDNLWLVDIDKGQINQVLNNLLINAVEAMPDNFGLINILAENYSFECEKNQITKHLQLKNGNYVKISVIDNGNGIPPPLINKIFDPYFSTKQNGTGLGLTTAYSIIHKHGGDMSVESSPGSGTIFTFYLPVSDIQEDTGKDMLPFLKNCNGRVLIIDEDILVRMVIEKVLRGCGLNVTSISEPQEAFDLYKEALNESNPYTLIILDISYQNHLSSEELFKKIRSIDDNVKIIALNGYSSKPLIFDSGEVEFNGILNKPFTIEALRLVIHNVLSEGEKVEV